MSSTKYLLKDDGQLNHGHTTSGSPTIVQWHKATIYHRDDPTAHDRADSWNVQSEWSNRGVWKTRSEREQLIAEAARAHNAGVELPRTDTTSTLLHSHDTQATTINNNEQKLVAATNEASELSSQILDAIASRLNDVEDATLLSLTTAQTTDGKLPAINSAIENQADTIRVLTDKLTGAQLRIEQLEKSATVTRTFVVKMPDGKQHVMSGRKHFRQDDLLEILLNLDESDRNVWITGPAGSGKTTAARLCVKALFGEDATFAKYFRAMPAIASPFQISGFMNANGNYVSTPARYIFQNGGILLFDECDGSSANALLEINAMTANGWHNFPDELVERHKDCYIIACANTWGFGSTANFIGRNKLDDATLDRFVSLDWPYDADLEMALGKLPSWTTVVQSVRAKCNTSELKIVISPRATMRGGALLSRGVRVQLVVDVIFGKFRERDGSWPEPLRELDAFVRNYKPATQVSDAATTTDADLPQDPKHIDFSGTR